MRLSFLIISLILSIPLYSQEDKEILYWSSTDSIQWSDFKGTPDSSFHTYNERVAKAISAVGMEFVSLDSMKCYKLYATFYCNDSWNTRTGIDLLNHERGHFDLTELYARKLRKRLLNKVELCDTIDLNTEIDVSFSELGTASGEYDQSTRFGGYPMTQRIWNDKIRKELAELEAYSDDTVICLCE